MAERLDDLQALGELLVLDVGVGLLHFGTQRLLELLQLEAAQQLTDGFRADHGGEAVLAILVLRLEVLVLGQELTVLERGETRLEDDVIFEIQDPLEILQRHVEQQADARRQRLQEPDVRDGGGELDMAHALAPDARQGHLDRALLADDALVLHPLVLAAQALVVLDRPEDAGAEQAVALGLEGPVVDRFRLLDLAVGPGQNLLRARDRDPDLVEDLSRGRRIEEIHNFLVHRILLACRSGVGRKFENLLQRAPCPDPWDKGAGTRPSKTARPDLLNYSAASDVGAGPSLELCRSTFRPSERISLTSTLNDSGIPASNVSSPRTIAS